MTQKIDPYLRPMYDALYEMMGFDRVGRLIERHVIEIAPLAFMRGRTLNESFVILDEAQNTTPEQMKMFLTRIGFGSRAVVTGDVTQTDLPRGKESGLKHVDARARTTSRASRSCISVRPTSCATRSCRAIVAAYAREEEKGDRGRGRMSPRALAIAVQDASGARRRAAGRAARALGRGSRSAPTARGELGDPDRHGPGKRRAQCALSRQAGPTNVLAFPYVTVCGHARGEPLPLGDLVICAAGGRARGAEQRKTARGALGAHRRFTARSASARLRSRDATRTPRRWRGASASSSRRSGSRTLMQLRTDACKARRRTAR